MPCIRPCFFILTIWAAVPCFETFCLLFYPGYFHSLSSFFIAPRNAHQQKLCFLSDFFFLLFSCFFCPQILVAFLLSYPCIAAILISPYGLSFLMHFGIAIAGCASLFVRQSQLHFWAFTWQKALGIFRQVTKKIARTHLMSARL